MKICELATATDLLCRRDQLQEWARALDAGNFTVSIGGTALDNEHLPKIRQYLATGIVNSLEQVENALEQLGIEIERDAPKRLTAEPKTLSVRIPMD